MAGIYYPGMGSAQLRTALSQDFQLALANVPPSGYLGGGSDPTVPDGVSAIVVTGTNVLPELVTTIITMPANPQDGQYLRVRFDGTQIPAYQPNTGQSFPLGAPPQLYMQAGSSALFYYDGAGLEGAPKSWYVVEIVDASNGEFDLVQTYPAGTTSGNVQTLFSYVAVLAQTVSEIQIVISGAGTPANPFIYTISLPNNVVAPGTITSIGFADNSDATPNYLGEYAEIVVPSGSAVGLSTNSQANIVTLPLTPGDWDVDGGVGFVTAGTTVVTYQIAGISTTSATIPNEKYRVTPYAPITWTQNAQTALVPRRVSFGGGVGGPSANVYLVVESGFTVASQAAFGYLRARRVR